MASPPRPATADREVPAPAAAAGSGGPLRESDPTSPLVEDDAARLPGQAGRTEFFAALEASVVLRVDEVLRPAGLTARDCPYLARYLEHFRGQPLDRIARTTLLYASPARHDADGWVEAIAARAALAATRWRDGRVDPALGELTPSGERDLAATIDARRNPAGARDQLGPGRPLEPATRGRAERAFGVDLARVRIHTDELAQRLAADVGAAAFTLGEHVGFGAGEYRPGTERGDAILAHEIAHTQQQAGAAPGTGASTMGPGHLETEADAVAVAAGQRERGVPLATPPPATTTGLRLQRCGDVAELSHDEIDEAVATQHLRVVVTQPTDRFLSGMKKSVAVAANPDTAIDAPTQQPGDQLIVATSGFPRLGGVLVDLPMNGERMRRPSAIHGPTGTATVTFMQAGRYDITAQVMLAPGRVVTITRTIDVAQADFVGASDAAATEHLASQTANTPEQERLAQMLFRADLRNRAVAAGHLDSAVAAGWTELSFGVATRVSALSGGGSAPGTATDLADDLAGLERALGTVPPGLVAPLAALRAQVYASGTGALLAAMEGLASAFDTWVLSQLQARDSDSEVARAFEQSLRTDSELRTMLGRASAGAVKVPAVFHPEAAYVRRELMVSGPLSTGSIHMVPLNLWLFSEGGTDWTLRDISNPEETFEYDTSSGSRQAAVDDLLAQLARDEERFPNGRLHIQHPDRGPRAFRVEGEMDIGDWLAVAALILAAAGIIMVTAGAATPGVVAAGGYLLTTSAVVGATTAIIDTVNAYERGRLTAGRFAINALQVVASAASAGTSTIFTNAARQGTSALARVGSNARYVLLNRVAAGADVATLLVMGGQTAIQLSSMEGGGRDDQAGLRAALAIGQLLVQGTMTVVSARDAFHGDLAGHPPVELHENAAGDIVIRNIGAPDSPSATGPRTAEDLVAAGGHTFGDDHGVLRDAYQRYRARCAREGRTPLAPLEWVGYQSRGAPSEYLDQTLPEGWRAARRAEYPGSHPELIDRPSASPAEGSIDAATGRPWRYRRVRVDDLRPEVDTAGEPFWTFPDLVDGEVLLLPSGTRVWKHPATGDIIEEHPVSASVTGARSRTAGESTVMGRTDMGPEHVAAGTERAHGAASPGLGFDSPYSIAHAPPRVNQILENHGIEAYVRRLRDNAPPGVTYLFTTRTRRSGQNLSQRVYDIAAMEGGTIHPMFQFKIEVNGLADADVRFAVDETSVFSGAETYGSPTVRSGPVGGAPGVEVPGVLRDALGRTTRREAALASPLTDPLERCRLMRERLDELVTTKTQRGGLDADWMAAQDRAIEALHDAERRILAASVTTPDHERLRQLLTDLSRRAGRHPDSVGATRLGDFADALDALDLD